MTIMQLRYIPEVLQQRWTENICVWMHRL